MAITRVDRNGLILRIVFVCLSLGLISSARGVSAGMVNEPNIVYANLSDAQDTAVDSALKQVINSANPECWVKGAGLIYMKKRPPGITDELLSVPCFKAAYRQSAV